MLWSYSLLIQPLLMRKKKAEKERNVEQPIDKNREIRGET